ncbi:MAG: 30S ribosomal protein S16 [Patescibacteria group bacterium]
MISVTIADMLKIRLQRVGRKHEPSFRLVLTDSKNSTKSGKYLEILGNYDARHGNDAVMKTDRVTYWMSQGAQVSHTVHNLLVDKKIITGKKINTLPLKKAIVKDAKGAEANTYASGNPEAPSVEAKSAPTAASEAPVEETPAPTAAETTEEAVA